MCLVEVEGSPKPVSCFIWIYISAHLTTDSHLDCFMRKQCAPRPESDHKVRKNKNRSRVSILPIRVSLFSNFLTFIIIVESWNSSLLTTRLTVPSVTREVSVTSRISPPFTATLRVG